MLSDSPPRTVTRTVKAIGFPPLRQAQGRNFRKKLIKIRASHPQDRSRLLSALSLALLRCLVRPGTKHFVAEGGDGEVVAQEVAFGDKSIRVPGVILEGFAAISGASQGHGGFYIVRSTVIEDEVYRAALRIDGHPLKELVFAVMDGIGVHTYRRTPRFAVIGGRGNENIDVAIAVVAPCDEQIASMFASLHRHADLGEAVAAGDAGNAEVARPRRNDQALFAEAGAAVMGDGHHDAVTSVPDGVERAIGSDHAVKALQRAIVVARKSGNAVQFYRTGPGDAAIGGA